MAEKKSSGKTVKAGKRQPTISARAINFLAEELRLFRVEHKKAMGGPRKPMERVVREAPSMPQMVDSGLRADVDTDVSVEDADRNITESGCPVLLVNGCGCGCSSVNITIANAHIKALKEGSENLVACCQVPPEAIPSLVLALRELAEERGVRCP